ncbi:phenylalanine--tRNA ligase subunit beta [Nakamurella aerolata]|uniref:Phenylalanine--tRNA ligase beta subunit n=1 Tax=Nakamurella aerolata TaxID=1656892 RepID=A0A849A9B3_9ACTN|nr:phenylalanine--tRNA ligase subunit beta [Nakamurella aerolata]NNG36206.1 phenylalanine--tRNA ligase subunit beta [Nakamurella aerolata]
MRVALSWLAEYVDLPAAPTPAAQAELVADKLVSLGFEVDGIDIPGGEPDPIAGPLLVGRVLQIEELTEFKKPIRFVTVDIGPGNGPDGSDGPRGIICGATNFVVDDLVVVTPPGTVLPGGFEIASRKTYGRISDGMICAADEVGIGTDHSGILVLGNVSEPPADGSPLPSPGADAAPLIGVGDPVIDVSIETDRGYAMSLRGLGRELAAGFERPYRDPAGRDTGVSSPAGGYPVRIDAPDGCARFVALSVSGTDPNAASPWWIRRRLTSAGIRSISLAVDVTNLVMLELGNPLHAYDAATLSGPIVVRPAGSDRTVRTLDGAERALQPDDLLITDDSGPIGLAGVMGGEATEISGSTTEVLIEAASFDAPSISRTSRRLRLTSEASKRFERSVDPEVAGAAADRAAELIIAYGGGTVTGRTDVRSSTETVGPQPIAFAVAEAERLAGRPYSLDTVVRRLREVGCVVTAADQATREIPQGTTTLTVLPPSWRPDLTRPADLVEEIARLESYDTIEPVLPQAPAGRGYTGRQRRLRAVSDDLAAAGLVETLTFPFFGDADLDRLEVPADDIRRRRVTVANPLDAQRPYLRTTLLPGLLDAMGRNLSRGNRDVSLFEIGQVFLPKFGAPTMPELPADRRPTDGQLAVLDAALPDQPRRVAAVLTGEWDRSGWWGRGRPADWADVIELGKRIGRVSGTQLTPVPVQRAPFHPGRAAELRIGNWPVGIAGELHPRVLESLGLPARSVALELTLDTIPEPEPPSPPVVSAFPPVRVDLALTVPDGVPAGEVAAALRAGAGPLLESVRLFDLFTGDQVQAGHHSLAFALVVRATDRTLTAAEANEVRDAAAAEAARRHATSVRA